MFSEGTLSGGEEEEVVRRDDDRPAAVVPVERFRDEEGGRNQAKRWVFTCNNPTEADRKICSEVACEFIVCQTECGTNGTVHLQGLVCVRKRCSLIGMRRLFGGVCRFHFEIMRGTVEEAEKYCTKEESRVIDGYSVMRGRRPAPQGARNDLVAIADAIREGRTEPEIFELDPGAYLRYSSGIRRALEFDRAKRMWPMHVTWAFGSTGSGKTRFAAESYPDAYWKSSENFWWCGYNGESDVIVDEMRGDFCKFHTLLSLLDRYPLRVQIKGGSRQFLAKRIIITSTFAPWKVYQNLGEDSIQQLLRRINVCYKFSVGERNEIDLSRIRIDPLVPNDVRLRAEVI